MKSPAKKPIYFKNEGLFIVGYVLVHGTRSSGSVWANVVPLLERQGDTLFSMTLVDPETTKIEVAL